MHVFQPHPQLTDIPQATALCFTGHRPEKLPRGEVLAGLTATLHYYIDYAVRKGYTHFYVGLADGIDYMAARYLFRLRSQGKPVFIIGVQPLRNYNEFFAMRGYSIPHLYEMQNGVDRLVILPGEFLGNSPFLARNRLIADHSNGIIAVCTDGRSGSSYTLHYAKQQRKAYCRIYPRPFGGRIPVPQEWPVEQSCFLP